MLHPSFPAPRWTWVFALAGKAGAMVLSTSSYRNTNYLSHFLSIASFSAASGSCYGEVVGVGKAPSPTAAARLANPSAAPRRRFRRARRRAQFRASRRRRVDRRGRAAAVGWWARAAAASGCAARPPRHCCPTLNESFSQAVDFQQRLDRDIGPRGQIRQNRPRG